MTGIVVVLLIYSSLNWQDTPTFAGENGFKNSLVCLLAKSRSSQSQNHNKSPHVPPRSQAVERMRRAQMLKVFIKRSPFCLSAVIVSRYSYLHCHEGSNIG